MNKMQKQVLEFHERFGCMSSDKPNTLNNDLIRQRLNLMYEELLEFQNSALKSDLIEMCDALCDLLYVTIGTALTMGIDIEPLFDEVHRSNMSKAGGFHREDGKYMKPDTYSPVNFNGKIKTWQKESATPVEL